MTTAMHDQVHASAPQPFAAGTGAKVIPLKDVCAALMCSIVRARSCRADGSRHGRTAAYTQVPTWLPTCRDMERRRRLGIAPSRVLELHFSPMQAGDMERLLERTRLEHGLAEVRRTWNAGYRALSAEFRNTVMR